MSDEQQVVKSEAEIQEDKLRNRARAMKRRQRIKTIVIWAIFLILIGVIVWFAAFKEVKNKDAVASTAVQAETQVKRDVYTVNIDLSGYVAPYDTQSANFRTTGPVVGVYVKEGDSVKKGQKLASIDSTSYQIAVMEAENNLKKAQLTGSEKDITMAEWNLKKAQNNLGYADIVANFDGVVAKLDVKEGSYFEAGGTAVITVVDLSKLKATVEIDEIDMQYVEVGQKVSLTFSSLPGKVVEGHVSYIPMLGEYSSQGIGIVKVVVTIDNPPEGLTPGFSFEGTISVAGDVEMLLIPQSAVTTGRGGVTTVQKKNADGTIESVTVSVKYLGEGYVQLVSGNLKEGDTIVYNKGTTDLMGSGMAMRMETAAPMGGF